MIKQTTLHLLYQNKNCTIKKGKYFFYLELFAYG